MGDFSWAESHPEIHKICTLFNREELRVPINFKYQKLEQCLQEGPQCGLIALAMCISAAAESSTSKTNSIVNSLLTNAIEKGYSNHGEMFSAQNMAQLARDYMTNYKVSVFEGYLDCEEVKNYLLNGSLLLVPYDNDKRLCPGLLEGHKAHWAAICGVLNTVEEFFVFARHGLARNIGIWTLHELAESNSQLNKVGVYEKRPDLIFKIPEGGISGVNGLKRQAVILEKNVNKHQFKFGASLYSHL